MPVLPTWTRVLRAVRAAAVEPAWLLAPLLPAFLVLLLALWMAAPATAAEPPPQRLVTDVAALRRCTDQLLADFGVRDLVVQLGEIDERASRGACRQGHGERAAHRAQLTRQ